ncbi:MAG: hypothetical protein ACRC1T_09315 [Clostridium chrysemydis]|uniref:hypothetical protein n=1 Tax=Clostridium chrysemydis TaxID=2665504 RepID=UPI003F3F06DE
MEKNFLEIMKEKYGDEEKYIEALIEGKEDINELISYVSTMTDNPILNVLMLVALMVVLTGGTLEECDSCECDCHKEKIIII